MAGLGRQEGKLFKNSSATKFILFQGLSQDEAKAQYVALYEKLAEKYGANWEWDPANCLLVPYISLVLNSINPTLLTYSRINLWSQSTRVFKQNLRQNSIVGS